MIFKQLSGSTGSITIPSIGLTVGTMSSWNLVRREETPPGSGEWTFRAAFSFLNQYSWQSPDWPKTIIVVLGNPRRGTRYLIEPQPDTRTELHAHNLYMEGVKISATEKGG